MPIINKFVLIINNMIWVLGMGFPGVSVVKNLPARQNMWVQSLGQEDPLDKEMVRVSSILAWKIPWAEEPGILQSMGSQRIRHDLVTKQQNRALERQISFRFLYLPYWLQMGFPGCTSGKELTCQCRRYKRLGFSSWIGKIPWGTLQ